MGRTKPPLILPQTGIGSRYERELEAEEIRSAIRAESRRPLDERELLSLDMLAYHLRTLLHRNDCLGMAAGIEARFPFLDSRLVKTAVNLPHRFKVRFSPTVLLNQHYFLRDKWVLRRIAARYLPPVWRQA